MSDNTRHPAATERRGPDPSRPGTVYRARPKLFRLGRSGGLRPSSPPPAQPYPPQAHPPQPYPPQPYPQQAYPPGALPPDAPQTYPPPAGPGFTPADRGGRRTWRPWQTRRKWPWVALVLIIVIGYPVLLGTRALGSLGRTAALPTTGRTADTPGRTYLVVGSDSRQDLTRAERARLGTGQAAGQRTDTIMLLHVPSGDGPTVLVSVPRDSYVAIPGHGKNKINAAYAFGGPQLLVRTIEQNTGLHIDDYVETGLGGYANLVDAIGGVNVCVKKAMNDPKAHINLKAGCQDMDGKTALGYARARYSDPLGDLGRVQRQRQILAAIASKTLSPSVILVPWRGLAAAGAGGKALTVDNGTSPWGVAQFVLAMRNVSGGNGLSLTVPTSGNITTAAAGEALVWDATKSAQLFTALKTDDTNAIKPLTPTA